MKEDYAIIAQSHRLCAAGAAGKGNNLKYHRPCEKDPTGKRKW
ncbi:hypothetical protein [Chryseobacterium oryctis]|uniref:Uncharacterized protein n=1 Tax=Chryseobacterium oryctis TaxID=2952618 RepID=A0ABT3HLH2_9FLAO|nr:hypothetical protein [Chryseobacterium oryctis]MCW3160621.1 hypothetical protein [Chryseobacterium oryctis]